MKRRVLFFALAAGFLVLGFGALDARAGFVPLPTSLDQFVTSPGIGPSVSNGNFTQVDGRANGGELLTFSKWDYSSTSNPMGSEVPASSIHLVAYTNGIETGFSIVGGALFAPMNTTVDVEVSYTVTAPAGEKLTDAFLSTTGGILGTTGGYSVSETLTSGTTTVGKLSANQGSPTDFINFAAGYQSIDVSKDIFLQGGDKGVSLSVVTQAFSSQGVPEPASWALLGIGMTGFLAFRRFFKKTSVA
jgi:hypothetical protein